MKCLKSQGPTAISGKKIITFTKRNLSLLLSLRKFQRVHIQRNENLRFSYREPPHDNAVWNWDVVNQWERVSFEVFLKGKFEFERVIGSWFGCLECTRSDTKFCMMVPPKSKIARYGEEYNEWPEVDKECLQRNL